MAKKKAKNPAYTITIENGTKHTTIVLTKSEMETVVADLRDNSFCDVAEKILNAFVPFGLVPVEEHFIDVLVEAPTREMAEQRLRDAGFDV